MCSTTSGKNVKLKLDLKLVESSAIVACRIRAWQNERWKVELGIGRVNRGPEALACETSSIVDMVAMGEPVFQFT